MNTNTEAAVAADMAAEWDEAYQIAFGAYMAERNFRVAGR